MKVLLLVLLGANGCGADCVTPTPDIAQGIFGVATAVGDVGRPPPMRQPGLEVRVSDASGSIVSNTVTDANGLYEVPLAPGAYTLVANGGDPLDFALEAEDIVRIDIGCAIFTPCGAGLSDPGRCVP